VIHIYNPSYIAGISRKTTVQCGTGKTHTHMHVHAHTCTHEKQSKKVLEDGAQVVQNLPSEQENLSLNTSSGGKK
jgi:hypothetical protein